MPRKIVFTPSLTLDRAWCSVLFVILNFKPHRLDFCELFWNGSCFALIAIKSKGFEIIAYKNETTVGRKSMFPIAFSL